VIIVRIAAHLASIAMPLAATAAFSRSDLGVLV